MQNLRSMRDRLWLWWHGHPHMCVACGSTYIDRPFRRRHSCGSY